MKLKRKMQIVEQVVTVLFPSRIPEHALELREICTFARVSESEAIFAIDHLIKQGYKIRVTDGIPRKFYYDNAKNI